MARLSLAVLAIEDVENNFRQSTSVPDEYLNDSEIPANCLKCLVAGDRCTAIPTTEEALFSYRRRAA